MDKATKILILAALVGLIALPIKTLAQEDIPVKISEAVAMDENITAADLGIAEPMLLPTSPYYPVKNIWRGVRTFFTFNPVKKAELKFQFANERLIEAKEVAEKVDKPEVVTKALENYKKEVDAVSKIVEKVPERVKEEVKDFAEKMIDNSFKQQKLIDKIEKKLKPEHFEKINEVRKDGIENFAKTVVKIVEPEKIQEKITKVIDAQKGSEFKNFKNVEILKAVEEKVPQMAKEAIRQAQENAMKRLEENIIKMEESEQKKFKEYVARVGGNEVRHLEIIHDFAREEVPEMIRQEIEMAKERVIERIEKKVKELKKEESKREFFQHLEAGNMEDLRIIKELENNLAPETIEKVREIKNKALDNFRKEFETLEAPEDQEKFMEKMKKLHDVKQLEVIKEIEEVIPEGQKEFFEKVKVRAMGEMKKEIEGAQNAEERAMVLKKIAGDAPEHIEIIKEFSPPPEIMNEILKEQVAKLSQKIETVQDAAKLQQLKQRITEEKMIKKELEARAPELFTRVEEKVKEKIQEINKDKAAEQLEKAKIEVAKAAEDLIEFQAKTKLGENLKNTPALVLLENAKKHLESADQAFNKGDYGRAFGKAISALHNANNVRQIIKKIELREEIAEKRMEEMEKMMEVLEYMKPEEMMVPESIPPPSPETIKKSMEAIELPLEETGLAPEVIQKIKEVKANLPFDVQEKLRNIPPEMLPEAIEKLETKIRAIPALPVPAIPERVIPPAPLPEVAPPSIGMPNPASEYCIKKGGKLEIAQDESGTQYGICHLPDGTKCEEWAFFKGQCRPKTESRPAPEVLPEEMPLPIKPPEPIIETEKKCQPVCKGIGTRSEGWYDSCTGKLLEYAKCEGRTTSGSGYGEPFELFEPEEIETVPPEEIETVPPSIPETKISPEKYEGPCIQVITPARDPKTGACKNFPNPCVVPEGWVKVDRCP